MPTKPAGFEPEDGSGPEPPDDPLSSDRSHAGPIARARLATGGYIARHPVLMTVLEWLGWANPGGSMNP